MTQTLHDTTLTMELKHKLPFEEDTYNVVFDLNKDKFLSGLRISFQKHDGSYRLLDAGGAFIMYLTDNQVIRLVKALTE